MTFLEIKDLNIQYLTRKETINASQNVSFILERGEILGIVGESGCGKSTLILSIMRLLAPNSKIVSGDIVFEDRSLFKLTEREMQLVRGNDISMIFQDPLTSLNPVISIGKQLVDVQYRESITKDMKEQRAIESLSGRYP